MSDLQYISYQEVGDQIRIAINRPPYNVLNIATMEEMNVALDRAMENTTAKVLVIGGGSLPSACMLLRGYRAKVPLLCCTT